MLHVTCDLCGKELDLGHHSSYVVKIEVFAANDPTEITEADLEEDHVEAVSQILRDMDDSGEDPDLIEPTYKHYRYDLCSDCRSKFVRDPLGKEGAQKLHFSEN